MTFHTTAALLGVGLAIGILFLVRRGHLHISHALYWVCFALCGLVFGLFPNLSDLIARQIGVAYGPTLVLVIAVIALGIRSLQADITATRLERDLRRLTQEIALSRKTDAPSGIQEH